MFKCQLAPRETPQSYPNYWKKLYYPLSCSPKLDGIRGHTRKNEALSRTNIPLPSYQVQDEFTGIEFIDGEFIEGCESDHDVYNRTQSHVMSQDKPGDISFHVFDYTAPDWLNRPFYERFEKASSLILGKENYYAVPHKDVENYEELIEFEEEQLELGFEGIMMRSPVGRYKTNARCTMNDGIIFKLKRFEDAEGVIIGFEEQMDNHNVAVLDKRGYAKRSSSKEGLVPGGTLGKFIILFKGVEITVGPGSFTHPERLAIWKTRELYIGKLLKFRYFGHGIKDKPRHPRAIGLRNEIDM